MKLGLYILERFGRLLITVLLISTVVFVVVRLIPGDPARVIGGIDASEQDIDVIRQKLGTDSPVAAQYGQWLWNVLRFDFGTSYISGLSVTGLILQRFPLTLSLAMLGLVPSRAKKTPFR